MFKKAIIIPILIITIINIHTEEIPTQIIEAQKSEAMLLDKLYDYRQYATEIWNSIIKNHENRIIEADKAIVALDSALEMGDLLLELEDNLISFYKEQQPNAENLNISIRNRKISTGVVDELKRLKTEFEELKVKLNTPKGSSIKAVKAGPDTSKWSSIDQISESDFRKTIYDYTTSGSGKFLIKKPTVLIFTETTYEPCQNQLLNFEDIYLEFKESADFYIITPQANPNVIQAFQVTQVPMTYYIDLNGKITNHLGNKGYYDIKQIILSHFN